MNANLHREEPPAEAGGVAALKPLNLLMAEDNSGDAELVLAELANAGYAVTHRRVETEPDFLAALHGGLDIVISDFSMPYFGGMRALKLVRESGLEVPFILVSGTVGEEIAVRAVKEGASDYLMKDRLARLGPAVTRAIEEHRMRREGRRADQAARESAAFIHSVMNSLVSAIVVLDEHGAIKSTNEAWRRLARENGGDEYLGQNYLAVCAASMQAGDADAQKARDGVGRVLAGVSPEFVMEYACHTPQRRRWYLMRAMPLAGAAHGGAVISHVNITERKEAEVVVRQNEERFRRLIENASDVIAVIDGQGVIQFQSPSTQRVLGYVPEELIGRRVLDFIHPEDAHAVGESIRRVLGNPTEPRPIDYRVRHRDGSWRNFQSVGKSMTGPRGETLIVVNSRDGTETRKLEEQYRQAQKLEAIGTFAGGIAHDFNNILAAISGYTELSLMSLEEPPKVKQHLASVLQASQRAQDMINQILTFSRRDKAERKPMPLQPVITEALKLLRANAPARIAFHAELAPDAPVVLADATQIHQVIMNLGTNACHAMKDREGCLTVKLETQVVDAVEAARQPRLKPGAYARVSVSDTGSGMDEVTRRRLFEPFFTTKKAGEGTGLGLAMVHGVMNTHDGVVTVDSEPGVGTTFRLYFHALGAAKLEPQAAPPALANGAGQRILLVDDEAMLAEMGQMALRKLGYEVETAGGGAAALERVKEEPRRFALVITDQTMAGMTGEQLAGEIRAVRADLPVILMTGNGTGFTPERLKAAGIRLLLPKPARLAVLAGAVQEALGQGVQPAD